MKVTSGGVWCVSICPVCCAEAAADFLTKLLAGLAGSPHLVSGTILSLSRLVYEFHGKHTEARALVSIAATVPVTKQHCKTQLKYSYFNIPAV